MTKFEKGELVWAYSILDGAVKVRMHNKIRDTYELRSRTRHYFRFINEIFKTKAEAIRYFEGDKE
jgi:hypothetical protein